MLSTTLGSLGPCILRHDNVISNLTDISVSVLDVAILDYFAQEAIIYKRKRQYPQVTLKRTTRPENFKPLNKKLQDVNWSF